MRIVRWRRTDAIGKLHLAGNGNPHGANVWRTIRRATEAPVTRCAELADSDMNFRGLREVEPLLALGQWQGRSVETDMDGDAGRARKTTDSTEVTILLDGSIEEVICGVH